MLTWLSLVGANLLRQRLRSLVTVSGVAIGVALAFCVLAFQQGYQDGLRTELDRLGAHLLVVPKGCPYDAASLALHGANWPCYLKSAYVDMVRRTPNVATASPVLMTALYDDASGAQRVYCGVEPNLLDLRRSWKIEGSFPAQSGQLLVGAQLAKENHWQVGQRVALPGVKAQQGTIAGILKPTQGADDLFIFLPLSDAQRYFRHSDELTHILVRLGDPEKLTSVVEELRGCDAGLEMTVVPLSHLFQTIQNLVANTRLLLGSMAVVALLAAGTGLSNTILMTVTERTREIGVLRAVGASSDTVFLLIWAETMALCTVGGAIGLTVMALSASLVEPWLRQQLPYAPDGSLIRFRPEMVLLCTGVCLVLGTFAALLPAWRAARLSPVWAIRQGDYTG